MSTEVTPADENLDRLLRSFPVPPSTEFTEDTLVRVLWQAEAESVDALHRVQEWLSDQPLMAPDDFSDATLIRLEEIQRHSRNTVVFPVALRWAAAAALFAVSFLGFNILNETSPSADVKAPPVGDAPLAVDGAGSQYPNFAVTMSRPVVDELWVLDESLEDAEVLLDDRTVEVLAFLAD